MKPILWLSMLLASCVYADEATDRTAIKNVILSLNTPAFGPGLFTADFKDFPELARLGVSANTSSPIVVMEPGQLGHVVISHEPWGEATIGPTPTINWVTSRFVIRSIRSITDDVALVDAVNEQTIGDAAERTRPVLFVMKKEGTLWRIASVRLIAEPLPHSTLITNR